MAIAYDAHSNSTTYTSRSSFSWSHTCSGSNRILFVGIGINSTTNIITSLTYNGVAMTLIAFAPWPGGAVGSEALYYLINPDTGSNTISVSLSASVPVGGQAVSYTGAKQSSQPDSHNTYSTSAGGAEPAVMSTTVVGSNCWLVGALNSASGSAATPNSGTTIRDTLTGSVFMLDSGGVVSAGSQSLGIDQELSPQYRGVIASFLPAPQVATPLLMLLGVGT